MRTAHQTTNDVDRAREALDACDPSCPRDEWVRLMMAAHAAGLTLDDVDAWSARGASYRPRDVRDVWASIKPGGGIGPATLFAIARRYGWRDATSTVRPSPAARLLRNVEAAAQRMALDVQRRAQWSAQADRLASLWKAARPVAAACPVALYLQSRALLRHDTDLSVLRHHAALPYHDTDPETGELVQRGRHSAMLAQVLNPAGQVVAIHRTYLTDDGGKANVESPKKLTRTAGPLQGAAIRLHPMSDDGVLGVAEGIETAISARLGSGIPTWATVSAAGMASFQWPAGTRRLVVFADNDVNETGQKAAARLAARASRAGLSVSVVTPSVPGTDWADVWAAEAAARGQA